MSIAFAHFARRHFGVNDRQISFAEREAHSSAVCRFIFRGYQPQCLCRSAVRRLFPVSGFDVLRIEAFSTFV